MCWSSSCWEAVKLVFWVGILLFRKEGMGMACLTAGCAAGATWLPADHPSTVAARQFVDELVAAAVALVAEQQGSEAAELFKQPPASARMPAETEKGLRLYAAGTPKGEQPVRLGACRRSSSPRRRPGQHLGPRLPSLRRPQAADRAGGAGHSLHAAQGGSNSAQLACCVQGTWASCLC